MKKHLSTFKYFVKKNVTTVGGGAGANTAANADAEKQKMYITADGERHEGPDAFTAARAEAQL